MPGKDQRTLFQRIKKGFFVIPKDTNPEIRIILLNILQVNPKVRPTAVEVRFFPNTQILEKITALVTI